MSDSKAQKQSEAVAGDTKKELEEVTAKWKRALADYQNLEKRIETHQQQFVKFANATLIQKLLPVVDDLERALQHIEDNGIDLILKNLRETLESEGVKRIKAENQMFDANTMECVETVKGKKDKVVRVISQGYMLHETVLRPAKVEVGRGEE